MEVTWPQPFNVVRECRYGHMVFNRNDQFIGRSLELYGEFSTGETELFAQILRPGDIVIEVGANIGAHTLFLARTVAPNGFVIALEPQRLAFQTLCANMVLNSITHAICLPVAAGDAHGKINVPQLDPMAKNNFGGLELGGPVPGEIIEVVPLDSLQIPRLRMVKVDVEGMETAVLKGAHQMIDKFRPIMYVENDRADKSQELAELIKSMKYTMYWHRPPLFNDQNFRHNHENIFGQAVSQNLLCIPNGMPIKIQSMEQIW